MLRSNHLEVLVHDADTGDLCSVLGSQAGIDLGDVTVLVVWVDVVFEAKSTHRVSTVVAEFFSIIAEFWNCNLLR